MGDLSAGSCGMDNAMRTQKAREDRGYYEVEVSCNGEADLHKHFNSCTKNPGHVKFIPVTEFKLEHLPPAYQDTNIVDLVSASSELTVRLATRYISMDRPEIWPNSNELYPFYESRGKDLLRTGTGWVQSVCMYTNKKCLCPGCKTSATPERNWGHVHVNSATHVVFDKSEGKHTTAELFYDSDQDRRNGTTRELTYAENGAFSIEEDRCDLEFVTHDMVLLNRLAAACEKRDELQRVVHYKYTSRGKPKNLSSLVWLYALFQCVLAVMNCIWLFCVLTQRLEELAARRIPAGLLILMHAAGEWPVVMADAYCLVTRVYACVPDIRCDDVLKIPSVNFLMNSDKQLSMRRVAEMLSDLNWALNAPMCNRKNVELKGLLLMIDYCIVCSYLVCWYLIAYCCILMLGCNWFPFARTCVVTQIRKFKRVLPLFVRLNQPDQKLTIIVSHPHGCTKQVTVGEWTQREEFHRDLVTMRTRYVYTNSTCPGSSGALVYVLGNMLFPMIRYNGHTHSRRCMEEGLNMSGDGYDDLVSGLTCGNLSIGLRLTIFHLNAYLF